MSIQADTECGMCTREQLLAKQCKTHLDGSEKASEDGNPCDEKDRHHYVTIKGVLPPRHHYMTFILIHIHSVHLSNSPHNKWFQLLCG